MRWLVIGLLASLGALLYAAGALARYIWLHRKKLRHEQAASIDAPETDVESEP
jgi:ATP-dependent protease ClpP protease subunit